MTEAKIQSLIEFFREHEDLYNETIEELDGYNGYLGDDRYYNMEDLPEFFHDTDPIELLQRAFFGGDIYSYATDEDGRIRYGAFNPNRNYFTFNGYGNLLSTNYKDYSAHLDKWFIMALVENADYLYLNEEVAARIQGGLKNAIYDI